MLERQTLLSAYDALTLVPSPFPPWALIPIPTPPRVILLTSVLTSKTDLKSLDIEANFD